MDVAYALTKLRSLSSASPARRALLECVDGCGVGACSGAMYTCDDGDCSDAPCSAADYFPEMNFENISPQPQGQRTKGNC